MTLAMRGQPHLVEHHASMARRMDMPRSLSMLLIWFRSEWGDAVPTRLATRDMDDDGIPQWHAAFRAWFTPRAEDKDGELHNPVRFWLWYMGTAGRGGKRSRWLFTLACLAFDWRRACAVYGIHDDDAAHDYSRATLERLWGLMYSVGTGADGRQQVFVNEPPRCVEGHPGCFSHRRDKSESQLRAEEAA